MHTTHSLPQPSSAALQHSQRLQQRIIDEIRQHNNAISFRRYMEMALYEPELGYYVSGNQKFGAEGDFVTAPEISPLFSQCLAAFCCQAFEQIQRASQSKKRSKTTEQPINSQPDILELGAGTGIMAADLLDALIKLNQAPAHYYILEISADLKAKQQRYLQQRHPDYINAIIWLDQLPSAQSFTGVVLGNEVLDAMPVERFSYQQQQFWQQHVTYTDEQLTLELTPTAEHLADALAKLDTRHWSDGYSSEYNPNLPHWCEQLAQSLDSSVVALIDYGYNARDYYHPDRHTGTLICHYRHRVHDDVFLYPGLQDITANVDFSVLCEVMQAAGLSSELHYQSHFLIQHQLEHYMTQALEQTPNDQYKIAQAVRTLTLPAEMGEHFKVAVFRTPDLEAAKT